jgi:hypothetical protein
LWEPDICVAKLYYWILSIYIQTPDDLIPCLSVGLCTLDSSKTSEWPLTVAQNYIQLRWKKSQTTGYTHKGLDMRWLGYLLL